MPYVKRVVQAVVAATFAVATAGLLAGCQEAAAASAAVSASKLAVDALAGLPEWVRQQVAALEKKNKLDWGKPDRAVDLDFAYVITYPTPVEEMKRNNGRARTIIIHKSSNPTPTL